MIVLLLISLLGCTQQQQLTTNTKIRESTPENRALAAQREQETNESTIIFLINSLLLKESWETVLTQLNGVEERISPRGLEQLLSILGSHFTQHYDKLSSEMRDRLFDLYAHYGWTTQGGTAKQNMLLLCVKSGLESVTAFLERAPALSADDFTPIGFVAAIRESANDEVMTVLLANGFPTQ